MAVTGSHISGRRLSTPDSAKRPSKATQRSKRSESATTVEEEATKLRAYMASRHGSLPVVVVSNDKNLSSPSRFSVYIFNSSVMNCTFFST